jgi:hypothetical protein
MGCKSHPDAYIIRHKTAVIFLYSVALSFFRSPFIMFVRRSSTARKLSRLVGLLKWQVTSIHLTL